MSMKLRVRSLAGSVEVESVPSSCSLQGLIQAASQAAEAQGLSGLLVPPEDKARLLHKGRPLSLHGGESLVDAGVSDGDTLVILERRPEPDPEPEDPTPAPNMETVNRLTMKEAKARGATDQSASARPRTTPAVSNNDASLRSLEDNLQHFVTAVEALNRAIPGATLQGMEGAAANRYAQTDEEEEEEEEDDLPLPEPNPEMTEQLQEMGFPEEVVSKALLLCHNRLEQAMEWLLEHAGDADAATPLTEAELRGLAVAAAGRQRPARRQRMAASLIQQMLSGQGGAASSALASAAPPPELVAQLEEMGFSSDQATRALRAFGNNVEMACNWLLASGGEPAPMSLPPELPAGGALLAALGTADVVEAEGLPTPATDDNELQTPYGNPISAGAATTLSTLASEGAELNSENEADVTVETLLTSLGLDFAELLRSPQLRDILQNQRVIEALQAMVEDPSSMQAYLSDPEVAPALLQFHRLFGPPDDQ